MKVCGDCGTQNDDTRVFCLNCAQRLPDSIIGSKPRPTTDAAAIGAPGLLSPQQRLVPAKLRPAGASFSTIFFRLLLLLAGVAAIFAIYLIIQPPAEIPRPVPPSSPEELSQLANFFLDASKSSGGAWQGDENVINRYLAANARSSVMKNILGIKVVFKRCYVALHKGSMDFTMQLAIYDRSFYLRITLAPVPKDAGLGFRVVNAAFGQLEVPGFLAPFLLPVWSPGFASFQNELGILKRADSAELSPKRLVIRWPVTASR